MVKVRTLLRVVLGPEDSFEHVQFDQKHEKFIAVTEKGTVYSGEISTKKILLIYKLKTSSTSLNLFTKTEQTFALIALQSGSLVSINIDTKSLSASHPGFAHTVKHMSLHPLFDRVITTFQNSGIIWDISNGQLTPLQRLNYPGNAVLLKIFFGPNGDNVISCFDDGIVISWDFPSLQYQTQLPNALGELAGNVQQVATSRNETILLLLTLDSKLIIMDLVGNKKSQMIDLPYLPQHIIQMGILTSLVKEFIPVLLLESGIISVFSLTNRKVLLELPAKAGKYIQFAVPSHLTDSNVISLAAILNDGNLEILSISLHVDKTNISDKVGLQKSKKIKNIAVLPSPLHVVQHNEQSIKHQPAAKMDVKQGSTQIIRQYEFENMLNKFGEFPAKYRAVIWKYLLGLPFNREAFSTLIAREMHPAFANIENKYPVIDTKLLAAFKRILSSIAHWCPLFAEIDYLPVLVFPFVKVLHENQLTCFETIMTYLVHWCHDWFQYFPAPPYHIFAIIESILEKSSPLLHSHFKSHDITCRDYAWPLLESSFSDIFTTDEWLRIWDHIFVSKDPNLTYSLIVAYLSISENTLLRCTKLEDIQKYVHSKNPVSVKGILQKAKEININIALPLQRVNRIESRPFIPLPKRTYPMFTNFPMTAIKSHAHQMQKIRQLEAEYIKERKAVLQLEAEYGSLHGQEEAWKRKDAILQAVDYLQKQEAVREEQNLQDQRTRLQVLKRQLKMKECALLESKKRELQREYQQRSQSQVARLEDTCRWIAALRQTELAEANAESEMRYFKQKIDKCAFEIDLLKKDADINRKVEECLHHVANDRFYNENSSSRTSEVQLQTDSETTDGHSETGFTLRKSPVRARVGLNMEEQLAQLERSNRNMEMELNQMMANLASSRTT